MTSIDVLAPWATEVVLPVSFQRGFHHPARGYCPMHAHADAEIVFHPRGVGSTSSEFGEQLHYGPGDVAFYPAGFFHDQTTQRHDDDCCVQFSFTGAVPDILSTWFIAHADDDLGLREECLALARCGHRNQRSDTGSLDVRIYSILLRLLSHHAVGPRLPRERLADRAYALIAERCQESLSIPELAAELDVGPDYLRHSFSQRHGISPLRHQIECRIARAKDLLAHAPVTVLEVGTATGFTSAQSFAAAFRRETGLSPRAWREQSK